MWSSYLILCFYCLTKDLISNWKCSVKGAAHSLFLSKWNFLKVSTCYWFWIKRLVLLTYEFYWKVSGKNERQTEKRKTEITKRQQLDNRKYEKLYILSVLSSINFKLKFFFTATFFLSLYVSVSFVNNWFYQSLEF